MHYGEQEMKTVDIITSDMHQLHGANKVTENLIFGRDYFKANGFVLRYVISQDGIFHCAQYTESRLGTRSDTKKYRFKRALIEMLKKLPVYQWELIQRQILLKGIRANQRVCKFAKKIKKKPDIIIYPDLFTAMYYLKKTKDNAGSLLISHADTDPLEQLLMGRPGLKGTKTENGLRNGLQFLFTHVDVVVSICRSFQNYMKHTYGISCACIRNGIEDTASGNCKKYSMKDHKIHIAIVASVQYRKGQDLALDALVLLPASDRKSVVLHIFGGGDGLKKLKIQCRKLELEKNVIFYGPVLDVEQHLPFMDAFMLPSRADTVPVAIIEAMRAGLPVFATRVGEVEGMIAGCGDFIEPAAESVASCYQKLIKKEYDLNGLGRNARERFLEEFQLPSMIRKYADVMKQI